MTGRAAQAAAIAIPRSAARSLERRGAQDEQHRGERRRRHEPDARQLGQRRRRGASPSPAATPGVSPTRNARATK